MNIIVLYTINEKKPRKTIEDSLYCFSAYDSNRYYYLNILDSFSMVEMLKNTPDMQKISAVVIHYSAVAMRGDVQWWSKHYDNLVRFINQFDCPKMIIPQDEYNWTFAIQNLIKDAGIDIIYTIAYEEDYEKLYPKSLGYQKIATVFTGYVDEKTLEVIESKTNHYQRTIDIGYRARKLPYWFGKHAQLKIEVAERFQNYLQNNETGLAYDVMNTGDNNSGVFWGSDWIEYLLHCRTMLGCLGGCGLVDWDGSIKIKVEQYMAEHPNASFEECEARCFLGKDNEAHVFCLGPRHFECAMTKTCQLLVEGDYAGVFEAGRDYIEIKKDFSNIADVIEKVKDVDYCKKIADNCYEDVIGSGKYTYRAFVKTVINDKDIIDKGNEYLRDLDKYCKMSHIEGLHDYGILSYKLFKAGKAKVVRRLCDPKYCAMRMKLAFWNFVAIIRKTPLKDTMVYDFFRKKYLKSLR